MCEQLHDLDLSIKAKASKGAAWITLDTVGVQVISFLVFVVMARFVSMADFGLIVISYCVIQTLQMIVLNNIVFSVVRKVNAQHIEYTTAFWLTMGISLFLFLSLFFLSTFLASLFEHARLAFVLKSMSVMLLFMGIARTHEAWMMRNFAFKSLAIRNLSAAIVGGLVGVILVIHGFGLNALVIQQVLTSLISTTLLWVVCPWRPSFTYCKSSAQESLHLMKTLMPNVCIHAISQQIDTLLIAYFFGAAHAGVYGVAKRVRLALLLAVGEPIKGVVLPAFAEIQNDVTRLKSGFVQSMIIASAIISPVFIGASALGADVIVLIFGKQWDAAGHVFEWLALGGWAMVLFGISDAIFLIQKKQRYSLYLSATYVVLSVAFFFLFLIFDINNYALPFILPFIVCIPWASYLIYKNTAIPQLALLKALLPTIIASILMFILVKCCGYLLMDWQAIHRLLILFLLGIVSYFLFIKLFAYEVFMALSGLIKSLVTRHNNSVVKK